MYKDKEINKPLSSYSRHKPKNDADEAVSVVSSTSSSGGYINGRNSANLELLIDKTSAIYLYVKLKANSIYHPTA
jgi:nitrogen fixation protein